MNRSSMLALLAGFAASVCTLVGAADGKLRAGINAERVLFLGNSITKHGPLASIGWTTDWGMAASALEKDYVHLVASALGELSGRKPEIMIANIADFERGLATYDVAAKLKAQLEFKPTLVIVAIGENVAALNSDDAKTQFKTSLTKLLTLLSENGKPSIVVRSSFWPDTAKDGILKEACTAVDGTFVDITALGKNEANYARSERKFSHAGVAAHPGDAGMKNIADAIVGAVKGDGK